MLRIVGAILKNPVELVACLAFFPLFVLYPGITIANLFVLMVLILSYFLFLSEKKILRNISPLILIVSLGIYYMLAKDSLSYIFVALTLATAGALVYMAMAFGISAVQGRAAKRLFVAGLSIMILLPLTFKLSLSVLINSRVDELQSSAIQFEQNINQDNERIAKSVQELSTDPFISDLLNKREYADLSSYSQNLMVAKDLDYLTITDENNIVLSRAHRLKAVGDDYSKIMPAIKDSLELNGIYYEDDRAFVASLIPLKAEGQPKKGSLIGGKFISEPYLKQYLPEGSGVAFYSQLTLYGTSANNPSLAGFINQAKDQTKLDDDRYKLYDYNNQEILLFVHMLPNGAGKLLLFRPIDLLTDAFAINLGIFLVFILAAYLYVKFRDPTSSSETLSQRLFAKKKPQIQFKKIVNGLLEYLLFALILSLLWWRSSSTYYQQGLTGQQINSKPSDQISADSAGLQLASDGYAVTGTETKLRLVVNNLKESPATIQALLKFDINMVQASSIEYESGMCQKVYDKIIDNQQGLISFSCDLKNIDSPGAAPIPVAVFSFQPLQSGIATFAIDESYSYVLTSHGKSNKITQTFASGENVIVK